MSTSAIVIARNRVGSAARYRDAEAEYIARQDLAAAKIAAVITSATANQPPLRPEQRRALVDQILAGASA